MIKTGITGQSGFIGTHLYNTLGLETDRYERVPFEDGFFTSEKDLQAFVKKCDVIVHLAAMNRHNDPEIIYQKNIQLVKKLIEACENTGSTPHILFSSSTQEERDNLYGKSKREGRELFVQWACRNSARFTGLVIPNVYGPLGNPYYNSVVATFCHQLTHNETPQIDVDGEMKLIYVTEIVNIIIDNILLHSLHHITKPGNTATRSVKPFDTIHVTPTIRIKVSALLKKLESFKSNYFDKGIIPNLDDPFERNLFITFLCYIDHADFFPFQLSLNSDERGSFVETLKLNSGGQVSFSTTRPGVTRGNHFHTRKAERFAVIKGKAKIEIRRIGTDKVMTFKLDGNQPSFVDMPVWHTHNITNIGNENLYTVFWTNEHFNQEDSDTWFEKV